MVLNTEINKWYLSKYKQVSITCERYVFIDKSKVHPSTEHK